MDSGVGNLSEKLGNLNQSGLDLLTKFQEADLFERGKQVPYRPINPITDEGPYTFTIGGYASPDLVMLKSLRLSVKFKIVKENGDDITNDDEVSIVNTPIHSLFENIVCKMNDTPISDHARLYPYKAFFTQMYSYSSNVKQYNLECERFLEDSVSEIISPYDSTSSPPVKPKENSPFDIRRGWINESKVVDAQITPFIDIMTSNHYLCPGHVLQIEFERMRNSFTLISDKNNATKYKIKMVDMILYARVLEPKPALSNSLLKYKNSGPVQYPLTRNVLRTRAIHNGVSRIQLDNIFGTGTLPRALYVIFLEEGQLSGAIDKNPFVFKNYDVMESNCLINGFPYPFEPIKTNFTENNIIIMDAYKYFLDNIGIGDTDCEVGIDVTKYRTNLFAIPFDFSPRGVRIS